MKKGIGISSSEIWLTSYVHNTSIYPLMFLSIFNGICLGTYFHYMHDHLDFWMYSCRTCVNCIFCPFHYMQDHRLDYYTLVGIRDVTNRIIDETWTGEIGGTRRCTSKVASFWYQIPLKLMMGKAADILFYMYVSVLDLDWRRWWFKQNLQQINNFLFWK